VIQAAGVSHRFGAVHALTDLSFSIPAGAFYALAGPNGAGKTTLLEILSTLLIPTSGEVRVGGIDVRRDPLGVRRVVGYCPAGNSSFWPRLTGAENLRVFTRLARPLPPVTADEIADVAASVGLDASTLGREARTYSDGQVQRLNLARVLLRGARVWLVDEPTRSLDPDGQIAMWALLASRARAAGATVLAATHDLHGAAGVVDGTVTLR
jgi:ABC-type multidrug transport system ATPase subunit